MRSSIVRRFKKQRGNMVFLKDKEETRDNLRSENN